MGIIEVVAHDEEIVVKVNLNSRGVAVADVVFNAELCPESVVVAAVVFRAVSSRRLLCRIILEVEFLGGRLGGNGGEVCNFRGIVLIDKVNLKGIA